MFAITATIEDFQMALTSDDGSTYVGTLTDGYSGKSKEVTLTAKQVEHIMAFHLDHDGEPQPSTLEERYSEMEAWMKENDIPVELRPMP